MIDFSTLKSLSIPEGSVRKITVNDEVKWTKPEEVSYTPVNYIQFSGSQHLDTGIVCNQNTRIEVVFTRESSSAMYMYGVRNSSNTASVTAYLSNSGAWRFGNVYRNFTLSVGENDIHSMRVDKNGYLYNGSEYNFVGTLNAFTANVTLTLGSARGTSGGLGSPQFIGKIYSFKMYFGDEVILNYVPCINVEGVYGFYDSVTKTFKPSMSTTAFTGG